LLALSKIQDRGFLLQSSERQKNAQRRPKENHPLGVCVVPMLGNHVFKEVQQQKPSQKGQAGPAARMINQRDRAF
jgi:hypothetical protein